MIIECDQIMILKTEWKKLKARDEDAMIRFRKEFEGMELYLHNLYIPNQEDYIVVSIKEAHELFLFDSVVISYDPKVKE